MVTVLLLYYYTTTTILYHYYYATTITLTILLYTTYYYTTILHYYITAILLLTIPVAALAGGRKSQYSKEREGHFWKVDCSWPAPGCFRGRIVREWAQVAEKRARMNTLRGKKCETFLPSTNKQGGRTIHSTNCPSKCWKKGRAHDTFVIFCLQGKKKGAGARYIRQIVP